MNVWLAASIVLGCGFVPCGLVLVRAGDAGSWLAAMNVASALAVAMLVSMTEAFKRPPFMNLAVVLVPMSAIGTLAFVRFLARRR